MNLSKTLDQAADSLDQINWKQVTKDIIKTWDLFFKGLVILMVLIYLAGKSLGTWVHQTNDWLAHQWVRLIVPPTSVETEQAQIIVEEVSHPTPPAVEVEVELNLPPASTEVVQILVLDEQPPPPARRRRSRNSASNSLEETVNKEVEPAPSRKPRDRRAHAQRNRAAA